MEKNRTYVISEAGGGLIGFIILINKTDFAQRLITAIENHFDAEVETTEAEICDQLDGADDGICCIIDGNKEVIFIHNIDTY